MPVVALMMFLLNWGGIHSTNIILMSIIAILIIVRHKENIARIRNGQENRFTKKPQKS